MAGVAAVSCGAAALAGGERAMRRPLYYVLDGHTPVPEPDMETFAIWHGTEDRRVALTVLGPGVEVSTVFLGIDHQFGDGPPLLFETMLFSDYEEKEWRYSTWDEAAAGHERVVAELKARIMGASGDRTEGSV